MRTHLILLCVSLFVLPLVVITLVASLLSRESAWSVIMVVNTAIVVAASISCFHTCMDVYNAQLKAYERLLRELAEKVD